MVKIFFVLTHTVSNFDLHFIPTLGFPMSSVRTGQPQGLKAEHPEFPYSGLLGNALVGMTGDLAVSCSREGGNPGALPGLFEKLRLSWANI
jgi:hypothetical protein